MKYYKTLIAFFKISHMARQKCEKERVFLGKPKKLVTFAVP